MQKLLDLKKKESPDLAREEEQPPQDKKVDDLGDKVKEATKIMEFEEKRAQIELHRQEAEISKMQHELEISALKLREKEQEYRLCELKIKELKRQTRHNALKPLDYEPPSAQVKTTGQKTFRDHPVDLSRGKSENNNILRQLESKPLALTEENMKLYDEKLKELEKEEDYEFYSNFEDQNSNENQKRNK